MTGTSLAAEAAGVMAAWDIDPSVAPRLISHRENAVFEVRLTSGDRAALRLHRPGYNSLVEIRSELWWMRALADRDFPVPGPYRTRSGDLIAENGGDGAATLISWVEGSPVGYSTEPLSGRPDEQVATYRDIGRLLARLHTLSDVLELPPWFRRRDWNADGFLGPDPLWGRYWENPQLSNAGKSLLRTAADAARADLAAHVDAGGDHGLIHADALRENVFRSSGGLVLIDFDDAGFGFRAFDLTTSVSQSIDDANYLALRDAAVAGYCETRPLGDRDFRLLPLFAMLRTFASIGWVIPRLPPDHSGIPRYVARAEHAAERYLSLRLTAQVRL